LSAPGKGIFTEKISGKQKSISGYETGATLPSIRILVKIAKVLKKPASYFLDEQGEEAKDNRDLYFCK